MPVSGLVVTLTPAPPGSSPGSSLGRSPAPGESPDASSSGLPADRANSSAPGYPAVIEQIQRHPNFQAGQRQSQRLPVVLDTPDKETDKRCWGWLNNLPGVHHVDVAFIHFEDEDAFDASPCSANADRPIAAPTIGET